MCLSLQNEKPTHIFVMPKVPSRHKSPRHKSYFRVICSPYIASTFSCLVHTMSEKHFVENAKKNKK